MTDARSFVERLRLLLDRATALHGAAADRPMLESARLKLRAWQAARLARTYADLLASPRMGLAATFFLTDLYNADNLGKVGANVRRLAPAMQRILPADGLETVIEAFELEVLSEELDLAVAVALGAEAVKLTAASYGTAYRKVGRRADRERQIDFIEDLGKSLDRLVHRPLIGTTLLLMRKPAQLAGLDDLQDFLQRGYAAFHKLGSADEFLALVVGRERNLLRALFACDDSLLGE